MWLLNLSFYLHGTKPLQQVLQSQCGHSGAPHPSASGQSASHLDKVENGNIIIVKIKVNSQDRNYHKHRQYRHSGNNCL